MMVDAYGIKLPAECEYKIRNITGHRGEAGPSREYSVHWEPCEQNGYQSDDETWERQDELVEDGIDLKQMYWASHPLCNYRVSDLQCSRRDKDTGCIQVNVHIPGDVRPTIYDLSDFVGMSNDHFINEQVQSTITEWKYIARDYPGLNRHCLFCDSDARWGCRTCRYHATSSATLTSSMGEGLARQTRSRSGRSRGKFRRGASLRSRVGH